MHVHRHRLLRNFKRLLVMVAVGIAGGILSLRIIHSLNIISDNVGMASVEHIKQNYIDQYKNKYGEHWKEKMKEDYKKYSGK